MFSKIFIDANVLLDLFDVARVSHEYSLRLYQYLLSNNVELYTSCDIITTLYYVNSKKDKEQALINIHKINKTLKVIEFSNPEVEATCTLMIEDSDYNDLEDTIQYILAKKYECDFIISNDQKFVSKDLAVLSSEEFCAQYINEKV